MTWALYAAGYLAIGLATAEAVDRWSEEPLPNASQYAYITLLWPVMLLVALW